MKSRSKWLVAGALIFAGLAVIPWLTGHPRQQFTLSDGTVLTFDDVSIGTNHVRGSALARLIDQMPATWSQAAVRVAPGVLETHQLETDEPGLVATVKVQKTEAFKGSLRGILLAGSERLIGPSQEFSFMFARSANATELETIEWLEFQTWPRRRPTLELAILHEAEDGQWLEAGRFRFRNPNPSAGPQWQPEALPATRTADEIEVTLLHFASGTDLSQDNITYADGSLHARYAPAPVGEAPAAFAAIRLTPASNTNAHWFVSGVELSDATGNRVTAHSLTDQSGSLKFRPVLWPDEPAWKLTLHLDRKSGFAGNELIRLTNVSVPAVGNTNFFNWTNHLSGAEVVLESFERRPDITNNLWSERDYSWLRFTHSGLNEHTMLKVIAIVSASDGRTIPSHYHQARSAGYAFGFNALPPDVTALNLTLAAPRPRSVDFLVAPNWIEGTNGGEFVRAPDRR